MYCVHHYYLFCVCACCESMLIVWCIVYNYYYLLCVCAYCESMRPSCVYVYGVYMHVFRSKLRMYIDTCKHTYIHIDRSRSLVIIVYACTYIHANIHTYIHTYIQIEAVRSLYAPCHNCLRMYIHTYIHTDRSLSKLLCSSS